MQQMTFLITMKGKERIRLAAQKAGNDRIFPDCIEKTLYAAVVQYSLAQAHFFRIAGLLPQRYWTLLSSPSALASTTLPALQHHRIFDIDMLLSIVRQA